MAAARAVGYRNAGTVEFIVDTDTGELLLHGDEHAAAGALRACHSASDSLP